MIVKLKSIEAFPIRLPRDMKRVTGTAGTPTKLEASPFDYRWSSTYAALYSVNFESALVKVTTDSGLVGWGEAQAPLAPEVACTIVERLLRPVLEGVEFDGQPFQVEQLWKRMYNTMRVRGQTGGFMLDAISGVDIALWDLAGKIESRSVAALIAGDDFRPKLPAYVSGLPGETNQERVSEAQRYWDEGFRTFKLFYDRTAEELFDLIDQLRATLGKKVKIAVDALWRLGSRDALDFDRQVDKRKVLWLECPLPPEEHENHHELSRAIRTPLALGESYRTVYEMEPFFRDESFSWLQPDLGRCGITEGLRLARRAAQAGTKVVPHVSIAMGPQIAAALHYAAVAPNCSLVEYNPRVLEVANPFLAQPIVICDACYEIPDGVGLGVDWKQFPQTSSA